MSKLAALMQLPGRAAKRLWAALKNFPERLSRALGFGADHIPPMLRMLVWSVASVIVAVLIISAPQLTEPGSHHSFESLVASSECVLVSLAILIAGNAELITSTTKRYAARGLIQSGSFALGVFGALLYARVLPYRGEEPYPATMNDAWLCLTLFVFSVVAAVSAVGVAALSEGP